jgi:hypothetical protein
MDFLDLQPHCSSCGCIEPDTDGDGYTCCCGKTVCHGICKGNFYYETTGKLPLNTFGCEGKPEKQVRACCWGTAEALLSNVEREKGENWYCLD